MENIDVTVRELTVEELPIIWPLISDANPKMTEEQFTSYVNEMVTLGYRCIAAFDGEKLAGVCGFWYGVQFWCGRYVEMDNVRMFPEYRGKGVGGKMMAAVEEIAREKGAELAWLKSYTHNTAGHKFFHRHDFWIQGFLFRKNFS